ncbi:hypothetical protein MKX03_004403 [Papaver bracteatum]|nr:hypothetical protein MKX03_004403 [Papaver bracteatum]
MRSLQGAWLFLIIFIVYCFNGGNSWVQGKCLNDQRALLLKLNESLHYMNVGSTEKFSSKRSSWNLNTDCCSSWDGIKCDKAGHVISLDLSNESLWNIDDYSNLFNLQYLESLNLAHNFIHTQIPSGFHQLSNMRYLNLSNSGFSKQIPIEISQMIKLVTLDLSGNSYLILRDPDLETLVRNLTGVTELLLDGVKISEHGNKWCRTLSSSLPKLQGLSKLQSLRKLHLDNNNISAEVPEFFGEFLNLTSLQLSSCALYGDFPKKVFQLQTLQSLDLSNNRLLYGSLPEFPRNGMLQDLRLFFTSFTGELPNSIGNLRHLSTLDLHNCEFNGSIPNSISKLNQLQYIDLSLNGFTGFLGENFIGSSSPLEFLDLSYNQLQGRVPVSIFEFSRLYHLGLLSNSFSGAISLDMLLHKLRNLTNLYLSDNRFSITTESSNFALYPQLRWLALSSCNLTEIPSFLRNQSELQALELAHNQISGKIPDWIPKIGNGKLNTLNLSYNFLEDPDQPLPENSFNSLSFVLDLRSNYLKGRNIIVPPLAFVLDYSFNNFTTIPNVSSHKVFTFSLSGNHINGEIPTWICEVPLLTVLDLSNNNLSGPIPPCMAFDLNNLQILNLGGNILEGIIPDFPTDSSNLEVLELDGNRLEGELPYLAKCTSLEVLNIGNNKLHGSLPPWLGSMSNLRVLVLRSNRFYGALGNQGTECNFPLLQIIDISSNNFSGRLPKQCFPNWKAMMVNQAEEGWKRKNPILGHKSDFFRYYYQQSVEIASKGQVMKLGKIRRIFKAIDFSNNEFDGEIPEIIGNLRFLYTLDFSRNALTGPIPKAFGNLTSLESLDLSHNKLTGEIPLQLGRLSFLSYFNLSFNKLEGEIPSGGQFETFQPSSFEGNVGLCGDPLPKGCDNTNAESPSNTSNSKGGAISVNEFDWALFVVSFLGFLVGAGIVIGPQYFWKKGREWANERINGILNIT